jgi:VWFA-related protein
MQSKRTGMRRGAALCVCFAMPFASFAQARKGSPAPQTLKVTTHLVVLNVVVTDKKGNPVTDLSKEDFKVFENEQLQAIATFEPAAQPATAEGEHASPAFVPPVAMQNGAQPTTILVLDELNVHGEDVMFAAEKLKKFLQAQPAVLAQTTSLYLLNKRKLELYGTPTRNRDALLALLKKTFIELAPHDLESGGAQGASDRLLASMIALGEIALANADNKGRKNVIWIGHGDPLLSDSAMDIVDRERFLKWIHYTANWLQQTQTTVYTIDPRGVEVAPATVGSGGLIGTESLISRTSEPGLTLADLVFESVAPESGGAILRRRNDLDVAIASAARDGSSYYTLSYYPTDRNWDGKFRKIRIAVARQELQARTQRGYYAFADGVENNGEQLDWSISRAVTSPLLFNGIGVTATGKRIAPRPVAGKKSKSVAGAASLLLAINRDSLSWTTQPNGDERSEVTLVTSEMSSSERVLAYHVREVEVLVEKAKVGSSDKVELAVRTEVPAKTDHIRLVLRDASSGRLGTFDLPAASLVAANVSPSR